MWVHSKAPKVPQPPGRERFTKGTKNEHIILPNKEQINIFLPQKTKKGLKVCIKIIS
jgi:hypothetical protein